MKTGRSNGYSAAAGAGEACTRAATETDARVASSVASAASPPRIACPSCPLTA
jgi:hypothetical protein